MFQVKEFPLEITLNPLMMSRYNHRQLIWYQILVTKTKWMLSPNFQGNLFKITSVINRDELKEHVIDDVAEINKTHGNYSTEKRKIPGELTMPRKRKQVCLSYEKETEILILCLVYLRSLKNILFVLLRIIFYIFIFYIFCNKVILDLNTIFLNKT